METETGGMDMLLHLTASNFKDLINLASQEYGLNSLIIEKDYWITHSLYQLSQSKYKDEVVFKGGTSLTKCYADLHRFSEDIDMALLTEGLSPSAVKKKLKGIEGVMGEGLTATPFEDETKSGEYRYTQFCYDSVIVGSLAELHPNVRFELMSFMEPHPYEIRRVGSFIQEYLHDQGLSKVIDEYNLNEFEINVLAVERTVIEKLVTLIRMSYEEGLHELITKTRHFYDLYMTYDLVEKFYNDKTELTEMVQLVREAEYKSRFKDMYPAELKWKDAPLFSLLEDEQIEEAYREKFGHEFVFGALPDFKDVAEVIRKIHQVLIIRDL
jgi:hypothetical protein